MQWLKQNWKITGTLLLFAILALTVRLGISASRSDVLYSGDIFRIGMIPWSDAMGWSDGTFELMRGYQLRDYYGIPGPDKRLIWIKTGT